MQKIVDFCTYVENNDFFEVLEIINEHIELNSRQGQRGAYFEDQINEIDGWLLTFECVKEVKSLPGILKSNPPQKAINITFEVSGVVFEKSLKLLLGDKLKALRID